MRRRPIALATALALALSLGATTAVADNPIVTDIYTADPAALVHDGQMYIYTMSQVPASAPG
jgi:arabinoxylan arabinofuranohydrolase